MARNNVWMSVSDLMTGLMVIFLFVAIAYIKRVQDKDVKNSLPCDGKIILPRTAAIIYNSF